MKGQEAENLLAQLSANGCVTGFKPEPIPQGTLHDILEAACQAPSPWNLQPWQFVVVSSPAGRARLLAQCPEAGPAASAPVLLVALADPASWKRAPQRLAEMVRSGSLPAEKETAFLRRIQRQWSVGDAARTFAIARTHAALQQLFLVALAHGVGACWVQEFDAAGVARELHVPNDLILVGVLGLGFCEKRVALPPPALARMVFGEAYGLPWARSG